MKEVFKILEQNAKATPEEIASMTSHSVEQVKRAIKKAEKERTILRYRTLIDWERLGEEQVWAMVEVRVSPQRDVGFDAVAERIYRYHEARSVYLVSGDYDLAVLVVGKNMQEVASFVAQKLASLESVHGTVTHFLLKRYKEEGEILGSEEKRKRLPLTP